MKKGFTLIELLLVMAILGILIIMASTSYVNSLNRSRDTRRKTDLRQIMTALQVYYGEFGKYPPTGADYTCITCFLSSTSSTSPWIPSLTTSYIAKLPVDPVNNGGYPWDNVPGYTYQYGNVSADGQSFDLVARLESHSDPARCELKQYLKNGGTSSTSWCPTFLGGGALYLYQQQLP